MQPSAAAPCGGATARAVTSASDATAAGRRATAGVDTYAPATRRRADDDDDDVLVAMVETRPERRPAAAAAAAAVSRDPPLLHYTAPSGQSSSLLLVRRRNRPGLCDPTRPLSRIFFLKIRLAEQIFRMIFGLAEVLRKLQNSAENTAEQYNFG